MVARLSLVRCREGFNRAAALARWGVWGLPTPPQGAKSTLGCLQNSAHKKGGHTKP